MDEKDTKPFLTSSLLSVRSNVDKSVLLLKNKIIKQDLRPFCGEEYQIFETSINPSQYVFYSG